MPRVIAHGCTLEGGGQITPPGEPHQVETQEEAESLVARGAARWPQPEPNPGDSRGDSSGNQPEETTPAPAPRRTRKTASKAAE